MKALNRLAWAVRRGPLTCALALLCGGMALAAVPPTPGAAPAALTITDDRGAVVTLKAPPRRIVSLLPSLTETVCDLGACARLVATDRWSNWPASVQGLPKVGGLDDPNTEAIAQQRPDLVLLAPSSRLAHKLRSLGLRVAELDARSLEEAHQVMLRVATLLGQPEQGPVRWQALQAALDGAARTVPPSAPPRRVYFEVSSTPYAASEGSFIGELLTRLGARNVVPATLGPFPQLSPEFVVRADPDVLMMAADDARAVSARPGWAGLRALRQGQVCALQPAQMDVLARPGPRLADGVKVLAQCLNLPWPTGGRSPAAVRP